MTEFYTIKDVAKMTGWSLPTVQDVFNRPDFPTLNFGKSKLVKKEAFEEWTNRRHSKDDFGRKKKSKK